jgi:hypothetical protein
VLKVWLKGGGGGIRREGMLVRKGSRVGCIEETQRKTMVCSVKEGSDRQSTMFLFRTHSLVLCCVLCWQMPSFERALRWNKGVSRGRDAGNVLVVCTFQDSSNAAMIYIILRRTHPLYFG